MKNSPTGISDIRKKMPLADYLALIYLISSVGFPVFYGIRPFQFNNPDVLIRSRAGF
jgi:hypothetical protein